MCWAVVWRRSAMATWWRQMAERCKREELRRLRWRGRRRWRDASVERAARASKRNGVDDDSRCLPHGTVRVQGIVEQYHAGSGKRAQRVWTRSAVALVANEGHGAVVWCGQTSVLNTRAEQRHSSRTGVGPVGRLLRRPASHCRSRGVLIPATPPTVDPAGRLTGECCGSVAVRRNSRTLFWIRVSSLTTHRSRCRWPRHALTVLEWQSHYQLSARPVELVPNGRIMCAASLILVRFRAPMSAAASYAAPRAAAAGAAGPGAATSPPRSVDALANELGESSELDDTMINLRKTFAGIFGNAWRPDRPAVKLDRQCRLLSARVGSCRPNMTRQASAVNVGSCVSGFGQFG